MSAPTVSETLRLSNGLAPSELDQAVAALGRLDPLLRSYPAGTVELQLSIKERGTPSQRTTLEAWIAGRQRVIATSSRTYLDGALAEVRDELARQLNDAKNRAGPRSHRSSPPSPTSG